MDLEKEVDNSKAKLIIYYRQNGVYSHAEINGKPYWTMLAIPCDHTFPGSIPTIGELDKQYGKAKYVIIGKPELSAVKVA